MILAIHQPQYMPWLGYFHKLASCDLFVLLDDVQFKKNEWQHRNRIRGAQGPQWLSVPNHYHFPQKITEVRVLNERDWKKDHLSAIRSCYGRTPFFEKYAADLSHFFENNWETIDKLNADSIKLITGWMGIKTPIKISSNHVLHGESTVRLINICRHFGADTYLAGAGGKDYMDLGLFEQAGIKVLFQEFACPCYAQHWARTPENFVPNLSALDLVFNAGPASLSVLLGKEA